ncbi:MAG: AmmeMemoRadiSam system protein B [Chloroflexota bacterium]|nr:MAG: AmmeMemoRadiSam system protein B [Chloroflexota bacterium]
MTSSHTSVYPRLRPIDARPVAYGGVLSYILRDPLRLSEQCVVVARELAPALLICDGTTHRREMQAELRARFGLHISEDVLDDLLAALDEALLLDNERFGEARRRAVEEYRAAPARTPLLAGQAYPADADELSELLDGFIDAAAGDVAAAETGRGVYSPHIDYERGGHVYARVWRRAERLAREAELVLLIGTDHYGPEQLSLTRQNYATPYGILPTDQEAVDAVVEALGEEAAFAGELFHRGEHSLELVAVWLQHMRDREPVPVVPVLAGSFARFVQGEARPEDDRSLRALTDVLRSLAAKRRTLIIASGDLSHVGPAFGGPPLGEADKERLRAEDGAVLAQLGKGDAGGFFDTIAAMGDRNNICGLPPGYLTLRVLGGGAGEVVGYDQCPADEQGTSVVSVAGAVFG